MAEREIHINWIGNNRFEFVFEGRTGRLTGRVSVAVKGDERDPRSTEEKGVAARRLVDSLAAEFVEAASNARYGTGR